MTQEVDAICRKHTLPRVNLQSSFPQSLKYLLQMLNVLLQVVGPDDDIVYVAPDEGKPPQMPSSIRRWK